MSTVASVRYQDYLKVAEHLEKQLLAIYGQEKTQRLFRKMDRPRFEAICEAASGDPVKRQWLSWLEERGTRMCHGGKAGEAA
jgi:hypothetical protein